MDLITWSWLFLVAYIGAMIAFGVLGRVRVKSADDFATARSAYGPVFLAFAFAATTASGATFVGFPGIAYDHGTAAVWSVFLYPMGTYLGVLICLRLVSNSGHRFGNRSIPEYLGSRYQSDAVRIMVSLFSLLLFFYLAGQLVSGIVMFELMLGVSPEWAPGHHRGGADGLCGVGRRPCGHPHRRGARVVDGDHRRRIGGDVPHRLRRGRGLRRHGGEPAQPG